MEDQLVLQDHDGLERRPKMRILAVLTGASISEHYHRQRHGNRQRQRKYIALCAHAAMPAGEAITAVAFTDAVFAPSSTTGGASPSNFTLSARDTGVRISTGTSARTNSARFRTWPIPTDNIAAAAKTPAANDARRNDLDSSPDPQTTLSTVAREAYDLCANTQNTAFSPA